MHSGVAGAGSKHDHWAIGKGPIRVKSVDFACPQHVRLSGDLGNAGLDAEMSVRGNKSPAFA